MQAQSGVPISHNRFSLVADSTEPKFPPKASRATFEQVDFGFDHAVPRVFD